MALSQLDHVNIRTAWLAEMTSFYAKVLGLKPGRRPPFGVGGAWLYCGSQAAVHLVEVDAAPSAGQPRIEHFAFRAQGLADFLDHLRAMDVAYRITIVPELGARQVNVFDPNGNHIEIAFSPEENADHCDDPGG